LWSRSAKGVDGRGLNITRTLATFENNSQASIRLAPLLSMLVQSKSQDDLLLINMLVAGVMELASVSVVPEVLDS
jgi:hypothetical protein